MKSVINNINETIIKKSKFISIIFQINKINDVNKKLEEVKKMYKDATHYCYAYIINNQEKCYDDGEPSGTAGIPILNVLKKENVNNVLCIIIRYFGGIKLGAGGLIRSYSKACKNSLKIIKLNQGYSIKVTFEYSNAKHIDYLLKDTIIIDKHYNNQTIYYLKITKEQYNIVISKLEKLSKVEITENIFF